MSEWEPEGSAFEKARRIVARKLRWKADQVLDWEVDSYLTMDRPAWAQRHDPPCPYPRPRRWSQGGWVGEMQSSRRPADEETARYRLPPRSTLQRN